MFRYHPEIVERYPQVRAGIILGEGLKVTSSPPELQESYLAEQHAVRERIGEQPLSEIPALAAWRAAFRLFDVDPTKYRSAAEALLRRLTKKGDIPSINALVDCCNLISIRYALPVAAFDLEKVSGAITVCFASGEEQYTPLGEGQYERPQAGEVIFIDEAGLVVARRWCWRQSEESAAGEGTHRVLITIEGMHTGADEDVKNAIQQLSVLLDKFTPGSFSSAYLHI